MSKSAQKTVAKPRKKPFFTNDDLWGYAFIGVAVIFFLMFTIYPLISAVITSLEDYKPFGSDFVGLKNYQTTFTNALFWKSLKNTLVYTAVVVPLSLLISFAVAPLPAGDVLSTEFKKAGHGVYLFHGETPQEQMAAWDSLRALAHEGKVAAASADALGETGKGTANYFIVIGIIETVALFTLVFSLLLLQ